MIVTPRLLMVVLAFGLAVGLVVAWRALTRDAPTKDAAPITSTGHDAHHGASAPGVDWPRVTDRDLDIAELFVIARRSGVGDALTRLETLAASDTALGDMGHVIAHALGRFIVAQRGGDPAVYADCREKFQAGCNHGVMEAYFASPRGADPRAVKPLALAGSIKRSSSSTPCVGTTSEPSRRARALQVLHRRGERCEAGLLPDDRVEAGRDANGVSRHRAGMRARRTGVRVRVRERRRARVASR